MVRGLLALALIAVAMPAPLRAEDMATAAVASKIRAQAGGKLKLFYRVRGYWPLWVQEGKPGTAADHLIALLENADLDGLDPSDYDPRALRETVDAARAGPPEAVADAELELSRAFARYVRDVRRTPAVKITYLDQELVPQKLNEGEVLRVAALAPSFPDYVETMGWMSPIYARLREALAAYRETWGRLPDVTIPEGAKLKAGVKGDRVRLLRRRLGIPEGAVFDKVLGKKVRAFQEQHGLPSDGIAGVMTIAALNRGRADYERILRLNLDRTRVLPSPFTRHIVVDAATARLWLYQDGREQGTMRVIAGKPDEQTPMLAGMMRYAILNPYWNVPPDLVRRRLAPKVLDGASLQSLNYEVLSDWSATPRVLSQSEIDWHAVAAGQQEPRIRQLPGGANAMGRMKFMFPNDLGIYLHDTPDKTLFKEKERHFSSGCVRLEDAPRLAQWLFGKPMEGVSDTPEQHMPLPQPVPVYLTYLTASPSGSGVIFTDDAYGRDGTATAGRFAAR